MNANETAPGAEPLLTLDEVAAYLRTPKKTLYTWRSAGKGPRAMKFGGSLRYRLADVDAWLAEQYEDVA
jgi:excisionase family DNA binding protein